MRSGVGKTILLIQFFEQRTKLMTLHSVELNFVELGLKNTENFPFIRWNETCPKSSTCAETSSVSVKNNWRSSVLNNVEL